MIIHDVAQGSEKWLKCKLGKFSASNADALFSASTTAKYQNLINEVVAGKVYGVIQESYQNAAMLWGIENEPLARERYEKLTFRKAHQVGFVELNEFVGMSPDGLIDEDGLIEIKCPELTTHISYLISQKVPKNYYLQMQFQMYVSGRIWCDFFSFYPDGKVKPFLKRIERNGSDIQKIKDALQIVIKIAKERIEMLS